MPELRRHPALVGLGLEVRRFQVGELLEQAGGAFLLQEDGGGGVEPGQLVYGSQEEGQGEGQRGPVVTFGEEVTADLGIGITSKGLARSCSRISFSQTIK